MSLQPDDAPIRPAYVRDSSGLYYKIGGGGGGAEEVAVGTATPTTADLWVNTADTGSGYPTSEIAVYKMMWSGSVGRVNTLPPAVNVVRLAFASGTPLNLVGYAAEGKTALVADLTAFRTTAVNKVILSLGGEGGVVDTTNPNQILADYDRIKADLSGNLDGIDWDVEMGAGGMDPAGVLAASKGIIARGDSVSFAPHGGNVDAYLPVAVSCYQSGAMDSYGQQFYSAPVTVNDARYRIEQAVAAGIPISRISVGMMIPDTGDIATNYWTNQQCKDNMIALIALFPGLQRVYIWHMSRTGTSQWITDMDALLPSPTVPSGEVTLKYRDPFDSTYKKFPAQGLTTTEAAATYVKLTGSSMTGPLALPADPASAMHAATKQYVDTRIISGGSTSITGAVESPWLTGAVPVTNRMHTANLAKWITARQQMSTRLVRVACIGNSNTYGWAEGEPYSEIYAYPFQLASLLSDKFGRADAVNDKTIDPTNQSWNIWNRTYITAGPGWSVSAVGSGGAAWDGYMFGTVGGAGDLTYYNANCKQFVIAYIDNNGLFRAQIDSETAIYVSGTNTGTVKERIITSATTGSHTLRIDDVTTAAARITYLGASQATGVLVANFGVGDTTTTKWRAGDNTLTSSLNSTLKPFNPDLVLYQLPSGSDENNGISAATVQANLEYTIQWVKDNTNADIIIQNRYYAGDPAYYTAIYNAVANKGVPLFHVEEMFNDFEQWDSGTGEYHISSKGHTRWGTALQDALTAEYQWEPVDRLVAGTGGGSGGGSATTTTGVVTPATNWQDFGSVYAGLWVTRVGDVITIEGLLKRITSTLSVAVGTAYTIGTVPAGFRPAHDWTSPALYSLGTGIVLGELLVSTSGSVEFLPSAAGTVTVGGWITLAGSYRGV